MSENDILLATSLLIPGQNRPPGEQRQADDRRSLNAMGINSFLRKGGKCKSNRKTLKRKSIKFR